MTTETTKTTPASPAAPAIHLTPRIAVSIERIAARAAEIGDTETESRCDDALAGTINPGEVYRATLADARYWSRRATNRLLDDVYGRTDVRARRPEGDAKTADDVSGTPEEIS